MLANIGFKEEKVPMFNHENMPKKLNVVKFRIHKSQSVESFC